MKTIAIITARGGSKRIPGKNIKEFCGKPILAYSIEAAIASGVFDTVMVSTDDEKIAEVATRYGAEVPFFRSPETSNDFAVTAQVLEEVFQEYRNRGQSFDFACCIYPTAPFILPERLINAMDDLMTSGTDSVLPVVRFSFPPQRGVIVEDGYLQYIYPEHRNTRSQDLVPQYHDAGQFYCINTKSFEEQKTLIMKKTKPIILPELEVQDIDSEEDWKLAEVKYQILRRGELAHD